MQETRHFNNASTAPNAELAAFIGGANIDSISYTQSSQLVDGKNDALRPNKIALGGGAANAASAFSKIMAVMGNQNTQTDLMTYVGTDHPDDTEATRDSRATFQQKIARLNNVKTTDLITKQRYHIPFNSVTEHGNGRNILRDSKPAGMPDVSPQSDIIVEGITKKPATLLIDPKLSEAGAIAAKAAKEQSPETIVAVDYGGKEWPEKNSKEEQELLTIFEHSDVIIVPQDAVIWGMKANLKDHEDLWKKLSERYPDKTILMSDNSAPVRVQHQGQIHEVPVEDPGGEKFLLAAGDTRNAGIMAGLHMGIDILQAIELGTKIASLKIQYPDNNWITEGNIQTLVSEVLFAAEAYEITEEYSLAA